MSDKGKTCPDCGGPMKNIPLAKLPKRPMPLDMNNPLFRHMARTLPQNRWTYTTSPFPNSFCRIHFDKNRVPVASFYLPGEEVTLGGTDYVVGHNKTITRKHPKPLSRQAKRRLSLVKTERLPQ